MRMTSLIEKLRELRSRTGEGAGASAGASLDEQSVERLMRLLCETRDDELSCEEVFSCLDEYVECLEAHHEFGHRKQLVEHHLKLCTDCRDELDALIHALEDADAAGHVDIAP